LDILPTANEGEIRKAYRKLAQKWHPDKNSQNEEMKELAEKNFRDINEAYGILIDTRKKQIYDAGGDPYDNSYNTNTTFEDILKSYTDIRK
jgi:DnaJ-class molecular chaperone